MDEVTWSDFPDFFAAVNAGHRPFLWQLRLVAHVADTGRWPELIAAPTGSGKSVPVEVHVFANAVAAGGGPRVPRRLVTVVNRRALVDSQHQRALSVLECLDAAEEGTLLARVRRALRSLTPRPEAPTIQVVEIRGGVSPVREWVDDPCVCTVIAATPDMWGSRIMFRGYGVRGAAWPREAGLLAYDAVIALDETHLNRQLALTARRIRALEARHESACGIPVLQVVELSATPPSDADIPPSTSVAVEESDLATDRALDVRLTSAKPVTYVESANWPSSGKASKAYVADVVSQVLAIRSEVDPQAGVPTVGCVVNRVDTAVSVAAELRSRGLVTELWVGRTRPYDLQAMRSARPGLFTTQGDPAVDVLVATATIEVGVDLDLAALVTELASGSALVQRSGRVNRLGRRPSAPVVVIGPEGGDVTRDTPPYSRGELAAAREWLGRRSASPEGLAPWAVLADPAPPPERRRPVFERLEPGDVEKLAQTSVRQFVVPDLSLWLRDDLDPEIEPVSIVPRRIDGMTDAVAQALLEATKVVPLEAFPATVGTARALVAGILDEGTAEESRRVFVIDSSGDITPLDDASGIRPGSVLVVDSGHAVQNGHVVTMDAPRHPADPVLWDGRLPGHDAGSIDLGGIVHRPGVPDPHGVDWCTRLGDVLDDLGDESVSEDDRSASAQALYDEEVGPGWQIALPPPALCEDGKALPWVVAVPVPLVAADEDARSEWTPSSQVLLASHQQAVADRAERITTAVGLDPRLARVAVVAAAHHDDGKQDRRFQTHLRDRAPRPGEPDLAKSGRDPRDAQRRRRGRVVPARWRHEEKSVVVAAGLGVSDPLAWRLIGTSHGHGRAGFPHGSGPLDVGDPSIGELAESLFDEGRWDTLIDDTHHAHGFWGCAYLEALVRAADCQVSGEGS